MDGKRNHNIQRYFHNCNHKYLFTSQIILNKGQKLRIAREILQAVTYMHACRILHLDIKPANVLVRLNAILQFSTIHYFVDIFIRDLRMIRMKTCSSIVSPISGTACMVTNLTAATSYTRWLIGSHTTCGTKYWLGVGSNGMSLFTSL